MGEINSVNRPRRNPSLPFGGLRKILWIAAVSILAALGFQSVAAAQTTDCSGAAEQLQAEQPNVPAGTIEMYLNFVPDVGGCSSFEGTTFIGGLSVPVYDPDTGEELGILKDLDPDLTSGSFSLTYEEFCGGFIPQILTAQEYYNQQANSQEQAILDPDSDGLACTDDDEAFLSGDVGGPSVPDQPQFDFDQTWNGAVTQTAEDGAESEFWVDADIIPVSDMTEDLIGEIVGEVTLVGLDCGGAWVLEEVNVDYVVVEERITEGETENCVESVPITLTPRDDGTLEYFYLDMNESVGECVLTRRGGGLPGNDDDDTRKPSEKMDRLGMNELPDTGGLSLLAPLGGLFLVSGALGVVALLRRRRR